MKKKIAVVFENLSIGGAERSLIQFLRTIDPSRYDVTLFTKSVENPYADAIPDYIRIWNTSDIISDSAALIRDDLKHFRLLKLARGVILRILLRCKKHPYEKLLITHRIQPPIPELFDLAIAYKLNCEDTAFTLGRIQAPKKCAWIHNSVKFIKSNRCIYKSSRAFQKIFCVSQYALTQFQNSYPYLAHKAEVFHNLIDAPAIFEKAEDSLCTPLRSPALVTVGRLCDEKGQTVIPRITRELINSGRPVYWYLIGDGPTRQQIMDNIRRYQVEDHVMLLGTKENPYPYMAACLIYVQTSYSEGWCLTTQEAKVLCKPVVTTGIPVMEEQFTNGKDGSISKDTTPESIAEEIARLLDHPELRQSYIDALKNASREDQNDFRKLYDFIENRGK